MFQNKTTQKMKCKNLPMSISVRYSESLIPEVLPFVTGETKPCFFTCYMAHTNIGGLKLLVSDSPERKVTSRVPRTNKLCPREFQIRTITQLCNPTTDSRVSRLPLSGPSFWVRQTIDAQLPEPETQLSLLLAPWKLARGSPQKLRFHQEMTYTGLIDVD